VDPAPRWCSTGATGGEPGDDVLTNLGLSIAGASDPSQRFEAAAFVPRYFSLGAAVAIDPRYVFADVQVAVHSLLLASFGFDARDLGQSVTAAEVMALIHTVPGVVAVDLTELLPYSDDAPPPNTVLDAVPASARASTSRRRPDARRAAADQPGGHHADGDDAMSLYMPSVSTSCAGVLPGARCRPGRAAARCWR
jgi:hypothetical protein